MRIETVCVICEGTGLVRKTFKTKLIQLNSDTPYMYNHSNL